MPPPAANSGGNYGSSGNVSGSSGGREATVKMLIKIVIIGMSIMMMAHAILSVIQIGSSNNPLRDLFVALYLLMFALMLFSHEVNTFYPLERIDRVIRRNFGFMYRPIGKGAFMIFIAFLNFGLSLDSHLGLATGIMLVIFGIFYILLFMRNPEYFDSPDSGKANLDPYDPNQGNAGF